MFVDKLILLQCVLFSIYYCQEDNSELFEYEFVANMDKRCVRCLCHAATGCNQTLTCSEVQGYCGPFKVSKVYWVDTGKVLNNPADDPEQNNAFEDCALHYECATQMIKNYMIKYGRDCNMDGVTDCYDYLMLHYNGGFSCHRALERESNGVAWRERFEDCFDLKSSY